MYQMIMIPSLTKDIRWACYYMTRETRRGWKRIANRRFRHRFEKTMRKLVIDPDKWYDEAFNVPQITDWDLD